MKMVTYNVLLHLEYIVFIEIILKTMIQLGQVDCEVGTEKLLYELKTKCFVFLKDDIQSINVYIFFYIECFFNM